MMWADTVVELPIGAQKHFSSPPGCNSVQFYTVLLHNFVLYNNKNCMHPVSWKVHRALQYQLWALFKLPNLWLIDFDSIDS